MADSLKHNIRKLGIFMLIAAVLPLFSLPLKFLPDILSKIALIITILYLPFCLWVLVFGSMIIFRSPCKKIFRHLIFIVWSLLYAALCWCWLTLVFFWCMSINGPC